MDTIGMFPPFDAWHCANCGSQITDEAHWGIQSQNPCRACGSLERSYHLLANPAQYLATGFPIQFHLNHFVGRKAELHKLNLLVGRKEKMISILGPPGIGKTAFARKYFDEVDEFSFRKEWVTARHINFDVDLNNIGRVLSGTIDVAKPLLVFLDGADELPGIELRNIINQLVKLPNLSSIILTCRYSLISLATVSGQISEFTLPELSQSDFLYWVGEKQGVIYDLEADGIEEDKIVEVVAPQIIIANDSIIRALQRYPADIRGLDPLKVEEIVAELLHDQGCEVELTPRSGDNGADILAKMDTPIGRLLTLVEVKRYAESNPVGVGLVRQLNGAIDDWRASHGMLVTTSRFTRGAHEFRERHQYRITLKGYSDLSAWIAGYKGLTSGKKRA
jgi:hypothetical protein